MSVDWGVVGLAYQGEVDDSGEPVYDGALQILVGHDVFGTKSVDLDGATVPEDAWTTSDWDELCRMVNSLIRADECYWPPFNPLPAVLDGARVARLLVHAEDDDDLGLVAKAAERYDLPTDEAW